MKKVAIVACSNGQRREYESQNVELVKFFEDHSIDVVRSACIYEKDGIFPGTIAERASELMKMFVDGSIEEQRYFL